MSKKSIQCIQKRVIQDLKDVNIFSSEIDAQILLEFVTGKSREFLLTHPEHELSGKQINKLIKLIAQRKLHKPIAYITGHKEFFGLDFFVTPDVLIPRPETEMLVEEALDFLKARSYQLTAILDMGTGSGNIIISIAKFILNNPLRFEAIASNRNYFASDISKRAIVIAKKNAKKHEVNIKFIWSDLFDRIGGKFDLIIANLPYVPMKNSKVNLSRLARAGAETQKLKLEETAHEPQNAIFTQDNGTKIIKKFLDQAKDHINTSGLILVEVDPRNAVELQKCASKLFKSVEIKKDFSGIYRVLSILT